MIRNIFCWTGRLEGTSLLVLLLIAMPVKYLLGHPELVKVIGALHGGLFLGYIALAIKMAEEESWNKKKLITCFVLSCLPFGTFYFEKHQLVSSATN